MRRLLSALGFIAALLIFATSASAASTGMYVGIGGTYAMQDFDTGDLDSLRQYGFDPKYDDTWGINGKIGYKVNPYFSVELALEYLSGFNYNQTVRVGATPVTLDSDIDIFTAIIAAKIYPIQGMIKPYFTLGLGVMRASIDATASAPGYLTSTGSDDETDPCGKVGIGVDYFVSQNVSLNLEGAYTFGFNDLDDVRYFTVSAGVAFHF